MPSRCIFFFRALSAWSILLSRTMICKGETPFSSRSRVITEGFFPVHHGPIVDVGPLWPVNNPEPCRKVLKLMAILKIAKMGHPVLGKKATEVSDPTAPEIHRLVADMIDTMV